MLDIKALFYKFMNFYTFANIEYGLPRSRFTSLSSMGNNIAKILNAMYNINYYHNSTNAIMPLQMNYCGAFTISDCVSPIYKYYDGIAANSAGIYILYSGYLNTWASSTSTSGTQYRQAATIDLSDVLTLFDYWYYGSTYYAWCLASIVNTRVIGCTASCTYGSSTSVTINAILTTSAALTSSNAWVNLLIYIPLDNNHNTVIDGLVVHSS